MAEMRSLVTWSDDYLLGLDEIDEQHKALFDLINAIWHLVVSKARDEETLRAVAELEKYALIHFTSEEMFMRDTGFSAFAEHRSAHMGFIERVAEERARVIAGQPIGLDLVHFLSDWLTDHILVSDRRYVQELRGHARPGSALGRIFRPFRG